MDKKDVWSTDDIVANRNSWSLAGDAALLKLLQSLSEKLITKSQNTLNHLNSFENEVNRTCVAVSNVNNRFRALSDTQFIESKVRDESPEKNECDTAPVESEKPANGNITVKLKEALDNGIEVLHSHYDIIPVTDSDSDDDEPQEVLLKARNPYMSRRLPFIIGTEDFTKYDHLGLVTSSEDEEEDDFEESDKSEAEVEHVKTEIPKAQPIKTDRVQVIRLPSSDSESEISSAESEPHKPQDTSAKIYPGVPVTQPQAPYSFADHLNATLKSANVMVPPLVDDIFSPPPFPTKDDYLSDEAKSDSSDDMFAPVRRPAKQPIIERSFVIPDPVDDNSNDEDSYSKAAPAKPLSDEPPPLISRKSSTVNDISHGSSSVLKSGPTFEQNQPPLLPKHSNLPSKSIFSAVNAELNAKLKINPKPTDEQSSNDEHDVKAPAWKGETTIQSSMSKHSKISSKLGDSAVKHVSKATTQKNKESTKFETPLSPSSDDIFQSLESATSKVVAKDAPASCNTVKKPVLKPKVGGLFDEDDSIDELFKPRAEPQLASAASKPIKSGGLFDDDLSPSSRQQKPAHGVPKPTVGGSNLLGKKLDLFDDDSDSGDDIFAIINSQKKAIAGSSTNSTGKVKDGQFAPADDDLFGSLKSDGTIVEPQDSRNHLFAADMPKSTKSSASAAKKEPGKVDLLGSSKSVETSKPQTAAAETAAKPKSFENDLFAADVPKSTQSPAGAVESQLGEVDLFGSMKSSSQSRSDLFSSKVAASSKPTERSPNPPKKTNLFASDDEDSESLHDEGVLKGSSKFVGTPAVGTLKNVDSFKSDANVECVLKEPSKPAGGVTEGTRKSAVLFGSDDESSATVEDCSKRPNSEASFKTSKSADSAKTAAGSAKPTATPVQQTAEIDPFGDAESSTPSKAIVSAKSSPQNGDLFASVERSESNPKPTKQLSSPPAVVPRTSLQPRTDQTNGNSPPPVIARSTTADYSITPPKPPKTIKDPTTEGVFAESMNEGTRKVSENGVTPAAGETAATEVGFGSKTVQPSDQNEGGSKRSQFVDDDLFSGMKVARNQPNSNAENSSVSAIISRMEIPDEADGNVVGKNATQDSSTVTVPGKLTARKGLNINVNALLPGSNWSTISKQQKPPTEVASKQSSAPSSNTSVPSAAEPRQSSDAFSSVIKERAKGSTRRRLPTRRARISRLQQSDVFGSTVNSSEDEPDSAYKTASESNSPDNAAATVSPTDGSANTANVNAAQTVGGTDHSEGSKSEDLFVRSKALAARSDANSNNGPKIVQSVAAARPTLSTITKDRARRPPNRRPPLALKKADSKDEPPSSDIPAKFEETASAVSSAPPGNEIRTSSHLGADLFSASSTREPPAMKDVDLKSTLFNDSDEDDDLFGDMLVKAKSRLPGDVDSSNMASFSADLESAIKRSVNVREPPDDDLFGGVLVKDKNRLPDDVRSSDVASFPAAVETATERSVDVEPSPEDDLFGGMLVEGKSRLSSNVGSSDVASFLTNQKTATRKLADVGVPPDDDDLFNHMLVKGKSGRPDMDASDVASLPPDVTTATEEMPSRIESTSAQKSVEAARKAASNLFSNAEDDLDDLFAKPVSSKLISAKPTDKPAKAATTAESKSTNLVSDSPAKMPARGSSKILAKPTSMRAKSDLFSTADEVEADDLFPGLSETSATSTKSVSRTKAVASASPRVPDPRMGPSARPKVPASTSKSSAVDLFEDDGEFLFSATKKPLMKSAAGSKSFLFDDDDDDDLFGSKLSSRSGKLVEPMHTPKPAAISEKARVVKRRSEIVEKDPLTGEVNKK